MEKRDSAIIVVLLCLLVAPSITTGKAQTDEVFIRGQIFDDTTNQPLKNATVSIWNLSNIQYALKAVKEVKTDEKGQFITELSAGSQYRIYVYHLNSSSKKVDYVPSYTDITIGENSTLSFRLLPAASIIVSGELWFVEFTEPIENIFFTVKYTIDPLPNNTQYVTTYSRFSNSFLNITPNHIIVPINKTVSIDVNATIIGASTTVKTFTIDDIKSLNLTKGLTVQVDIQKYSSTINFNSVNDRFEVSENLLTNLEEKGFYVVAEGQDLTKVRNLFESAQTRYIQGLYDECHADLREAYITAASLIQRLNKIYNDASTSVYILTLFLAVTSVVLSLLIFEQLVTRGLASIPFFFLFSTIFYLTYPGSKIVTLTSFLIGSTLSLGFAFLAVLLLPFVLGSRVVSTFSLARHYFKRRKLRFGLTLISVTVLVMSFVSLTSFSTGYGLTVKAYKIASPNPRGLLIKQAIPVEQSSLFNFIPMNPLTYDLIKGKPEILTVAPKFESFPMFESTSFRSLSSLTTPSKKSHILGVLGIQPSAESEITRIEQAVVKGRYLIDGEEGSILISVKMAEKLDIEINEKVVLNDFGSIESLTVVGLFDDSQFSEVRDVDGGRVIPQKLFFFEDQAQLRPCEPEEVIITTWEPASKMFAVFLSRIDGLMTDMSLGLNLARQIALEQGLIVWFSEGIQNYEVVVGSYLEMKGLTVLIPWFIVILNVIITMLNAIYEQRREIAILSSIGLNPSHIVGLIIAEAGIIGVVGGGIGYLLGLGSYSLMTFLSIIVEVRQKVSAAWSLVAISVSLAAVLAGAFIALRSSVVITPSFMRKWRTTGMDLSSREGRIFEMPIKPLEEDLEPMFNHIIKRFQNSLQEAGAFSTSDWIKRFDETTEEGETKGFSFSFVPGQRHSIGGASFKLMARKRKGDKLYSVEVVYGAGSPESIYKTTDFLRMELIKYSTPQKAE